MAARSDLAGSTTGLGCLVRSAVAVGVSVRVEAQQDLPELLQFFIGQPRKILLDRNRGAIRATVLVPEVVAVAQQVLGEEDIRGRVAFGSQGPKAAP